MNWSRNIPLLSAVSFAAIALTTSLSQGIASLEVYAAAMVFASTLLALTLRQTKLLFVSVLLIWCALLAPLLRDLSTQPLVTALIYKVAVTVAICSLVLFSDGPLRRPQTVIFAVLLAGLSLFGFSFFGLTVAQLDALGTDTLSFSGFPLLTKSDVLLLIVPLVLSVIYLGLRRSLDLSYLVFVCFALLIINSDALSTRLVLLTAIEIALVVVLLLIMSQRVWRDSLTGLPGRQRLDSDLKRMPVGSLAAFVDIDHFKKFNDKYGHANGDLVLQAVAKELARCRFAQAYRYGGEEFILLAKPMDVDRFSQQLNGLRERIAAKKFQLSVSVATKSVTKKPAAKKGASRASAKRAKTAKAVSVQISAGIGKLLLAMSHQDWLKQADNALYQAKAAGRNCVVVTKTLKERRAKRR